MCSQVQDLYNNYYGQLKSAQKFSIQTRSKQTRPVQQLIWTNNILANI